MVILVVTLDLTTIYAIYTGLECSDRSETLTNQKYGFQRIAIEVQIFSELCLSKKLEPLEVVPLSKLRVFSSKVRISL